MRNGGFVTGEADIAIPLHQLAVHQGRECAVLGDFTLEDDLVQPLDRSIVGKVFAAEGLGLHHGEFAVGGAVHQFEGSRTVLDADILAHNGLHKVFLVFRAVLGHVNGVLHREGRGLGKTVIHREGRFVSTRLVATFRIRKGKQGGVYNLMLALGSVIIVLAGNGDGTAVLNLILPFVRLIGGQHTVHVYGTGGIGKVEAAIGRVELGHRAGELIVVLLVCQLNELLYCLGRGIGIFIRRLVATGFITTGLVTALTVTVCKVQLNNLRIVTGTGRAVIVHLPSFGSGKFPGIFGTLLRQSLVFTARDHRTTQV